MRPGAGNPEMAGSYCRDHRSGRQRGSRLSPLRSFCCCVISATSERFEFTTGAGVGLAVKVVSKGPFGPPIPGGGSFTSRLSPRSTPPPVARRMSVCATRGRYRSTSMSRLFLQRQRDRIRQ